VFAADASFFPLAKIRVTIEKDVLKQLTFFEQQVSSGQNQIMSITVENGSEEIAFSLLGKENAIPHRLILQRIIGGAVKEILFNTILPKPFIASVERTGAAIFRRELDITRNRLLETMASQGKDLDPFELLQKAYSRYALPVNANVDFARDYESISKETNSLKRSAALIATRFQTLCGGKFEFKNSKLVFVPEENVKLKLDINESSSSVRSLFHLGGYLAHLATPGDLLIIDEPELNLHPKNQRLVARLLAILCNQGVSVFITTHSDYIVRELNTLLLLYKQTPHMEAVRNKYNYSRDELLSADSVRIYTVAEKMVLLEGGKRKQRARTLVPVPVSQEEGVGISSFDDATDEMNRIQDEILYGEP
ncbi:MAG: AAA family ATPase, partial [Magnetococcales bacterium]|nr:AAA family ATPase [Magnetococcales bacterium]